MNTLFIIPVLGVPGWGQIAVVLVLIVLLFGAKRIPELMRGAGRGIKEFKDAMNKDYSQETDDKPKTDKDQNENS
ncbi:MAG: twin-arginine translocase TatA/TatE family subunit [Rikenellaceae bacterium]|jgi:sec-independent protein translocase protein TatA|nr:twin-arginine translocase TatA/TatE family subunit [Rikenellaceae bacterium]